MRDPDVFGINCGQPLTKLEQIDYLKMGIEGHSEPLDEDQQLIALNELREAWERISELEDQVQELTYEVEESKE